METDTRVPNKNLGTGLRF